MHFLRLPSLSSPSPQHVVFSKGVKSKPCKQNWNAKNGFDWRHLQNLLKTGLSVKVKVLNDGFVLFLLSFLYILLHESTANAIVTLYYNGTIAVAVGLWRRMHGTVSRSKNLKLSKFTYKIISEDQKFSNLENLFFNNSASWCPTATPSEIAEIW